MVHPFSKPFFATHRTKFVLFGPYFYSERRCLRVTLWVKKLKIF